MKKNHRPSFGYILLLTLFFDSILFVSVAEKAASSSFFLLTGVSFLFSLFADFLLWSLARRGKLDSILRRFPRLVSYCIDIILLLTIFWGNKIAWPWNGLILFPSNLLLLWMILVHPFSKETDEELRKDVEHLFP